ncbi:MAG: membrane dipeptidase [Polyangiaceae bacterium]
MAIAYIDHRQAPSAWARALGISEEAVALYLDSDVLDLHVDSFIWHRIFGYDLKRRHGHGLFGARFYSQVDFPRILEAQLSGAIWVITTNPAPSATRRRRAFVKNQRRLKALFAEVDDQFALVRNVAEYRAARDAGKHAAFVGIQGGNALDESLDALDLIEDDLIVRITLVHLSSSRLGITSAPIKGADTGLSDFGRDYLKRLDEKKILVDLAHISKKGFWDAVATHDRSLPLIVTHTGVSGVHEHWRNLDDDQLRAIADSGGTVGVMYQSSFLGDAYWGGTAASIVDHLDHIIATVGDDHASLGSDWDGAIVPPRDMPTCLELPRLVQIMLDRGWKEETVRKVLGGNFLRVVASIRG